jgi:hypothetical protein
MNAPKLERSGAWVWAGREAPPGKSAREWFR